MINNLLFNVIVFAVCGIFSGFVFNFSTQKHFQKFIHFQTVFWSELTKSESDITGQTSKLISLYVLFCKFFLSCLLLLAPMYLPLFFIQPNIWLKLILTTEAIFSYALLSMFTYLILKYAKSNN